MVSSRATAAQWTRFFNVLHTLLADSAIVAEGVDAKERKGIELGAVAVRAVMAELDGNAAAELSAERGRQGAAILGAVFGGFGGAVYGFGASGWPARLGAATVYGGMAALAAWLVVLGFAWLLYPPSSSHRPGQ